MRGSGLPCFTSKSRTRLTSNEEEIPNGWNEDICFFHMLRSRAQRSQIRSLLTGIGYEPIMSEHSDVLFDHRLHTHTSCIKDISNADMVVLLIGSRFGGIAIPDAVSEIDIPAVVKATSSSEIAKNSDRLSITQVEIMKAIELNVPMFVFVDSKVHADHHLYQKNKDKEFADKIEYPSIERPETAKYIFEFINLISHRYANNAITPYSNFSDIEDHLLKQWSMMFQRLLREEREKSIDSRRSDAILEQIQDLKAAVLQSIGTGSGQDIARSVLKYRRLVDFVLGMRVFNPSVDLVDFTGSFDDLLAEFGVVEVVQSPASRTLAPRTILIREDDTHIRARVPDQRFMQFHVEWKAFSQLERETKQAVLEGVSDVESLGASMVQLMPEPYQEETASTFDYGGARNALLDVLPDSAGDPTATGWTDDRLEVLRRMWDEGKTASQIADALGGVSRNAVIGKAHRLGLRSRPAPPR